jgi:xanthine dehydrogenase YagS FAD-binding subunit
VGSDGERRVAAREFYTLPSNTSHYVADLKPGELITSVILPIDQVARNSFYLKIRDRSSYAFALASASVGLELEGRGNNAIIRTARVGLGGLAAVPWHSAEAVGMLEGNRASDQTFRAAAEAALADARPPEGVEYKVELAKRTLVRALRVLRDQGPLDDDALWALQHGRS